MTNIVQLFGRIMLALIFALAGFSILAALLFHKSFADQMQMILFMKNIAMAGGLLLLSVGGRTGFSLDK